MPTNLQINDQLLAETQKAGGFRSPTEAVNEALAEFVRSRTQAKISELFGTIDFAPDFDPKQLRAKQRKP